MSIKVGVLVNFFRVIKWYVVSEICFLLYVKKGICNVVSGFFFCCLIFFVMMEMVFEINYVFLVGIKEEEKVYEIMKLEIGWMWFDI